MKLSMLIWKFQLQQINSLYKMPIIKLNIIT